jgi:hypothetical protein
MRSRFRWFALGLIALDLVAFGAGVANAELPILPAAERIHELPLPNGFGEQNRASLIQPAQMARNAVLELAQIRAPGADLVDVISIDARQLRVMILGPNGEYAGFEPLPRLPGPRELRFQGEALELVWLAQSLEPTYGETHITMRPYRGHHGHARFTVGPGTIVGTIVTEKTVYRILTVDREIQGVYRLRARGGTAAKYQRIAKETNALLASAELRHVRMERLADMQPERVYASDRGRSLFIRGGELGELSDLTEAAVMQVMERFAELAYVPKNFAIQVTRIFDHPKGRLVEFRQVIDGIPVWSGNRIEATAAGVITEISTQLADPAWASSRRRMSEAEALQFAKTAIQEESGEIAGQVEFFNPTELYYYVVPPDPKLAPTYGFFLRTPQGRSFGVRVHAQSGEAQILRPVE